MWLHGHASLNLVKKNSACEKLVKPLTVALTRGQRSKRQLYKLFSVANLRYQIIKTKLYDNLFNLLRRARVNRVITCTVNSSL